MSEATVDVAIVGGGLGGALLAACLGEARGALSIALIERRPDMRKMDGQVSVGRSINLALSARGLAALSRIPSVSQRVKEMCIPMRGRFLHPATAEKPDLGTKVQMYSHDGKAAIHSVSRGGINMALLDACEACENVTMYFEHALVDVDIRQKVVVMERPDGERVTLRAKVIIGADGAFSRVRAELQRVPRFDYSIKHLHVGYKELCFPPADKPEDAVEDGIFRLPKNYLHIWPRGPFMIIALPNLDGSFTVTCFWPWEGPCGFDVMDKAADQELLAFFRKEFPDALPHLPTLLEDFRANRTSPLATVKCEPWAIGGDVALIGDAAHAVVPFFGQGMNASFEDVDVLMDVLNEVGGDDFANPDWEKVLPRYAALRKPNGDAIADMAVENFNEMASKTADQGFLARKHVEHWLGNTFPGEYYSRYELVSFSTIPYARAVQIGKVNLRICKTLMQGIDANDIQSEEDADRLCDKKLAKRLIEELLPRNMLTDFEAPIPGLSGSSRL